MSFFNLILLTYRIIKGNPHETLGIWKRTIGKIIFKSHIFALSLHREHLKTLDKGLA